MMYGSVTIEAISRHITSAFHDQSNDARVWTLISIYTAMRKVMRRSFQYLISSHSVQLKLSRYIVTMALSFLKLAVLLPILLGVAAPLNNTTGNDLALGADDAIVILSDGEMHIMKKDEVRAFAEEVKGVNLTDPSVAEWSSLPVGNETTADGSPDSLPTTGSLYVRYTSGDENLIVPGISYQFLGWDIPMSSVVHAKDHDATVALTSGHMIANTITASGSATLALVDRFLSVTATASYAHAVTASVSGAITMTIPAGKYGLIVSEPWTNRVTGYDWSGQPGHPSSQFWYADSHQDATLELCRGTLKWVKGVITTCTSDSYPIKRCVGKRNMY